MSGEPTAIDEFKLATEALQTIGYYLNVRLAARQQGTDANLPLAVQSILDLATALPKPDAANWSRLVVGKLPGAKPKAKPKASANGEGEGEGDKRPRGKWTEESKAELVRLVEDDAYRAEVMGKSANYAGVVNWAALARRLAFSGTAPLHRQYSASTGKEPPHATRAKKADAAEGEAKGEAAAPPAAKKAKTEAVVAASAAAGPSDGWTDALSKKLVRLVEDEAFRKDVTGKRHLKWSRVADALGKGKKESKKKYTAVTGKAVED